jgi:hypothetical protein
MAHLRKLFAQVSRIPNLQSDPLQRSPISVTVLLPNPKIRKFSSIAICFPSSDFERIDKEKLDRFPEVTGR